MRQGLPLDAVAADLDAGAAQGEPGLAVAVGAVVALGDLLDQREQPLVAGGPLRALPGFAVVVGGRRHVQGLADRLDPEARAVLVDERAHFVRSWSSSVAKNTLAAFKISLARLSS